MPEVRQQVAQTQKLSQGIRTAIHLLTLDAGEMSEELLREAEANPALEVVPPKVTGTAYRKPAQPEWQEIASHDSPLEDLRRQLRLNVSEPAVRRTALHLLQELDRRGYYTQSLASFAREEGITLQLAQKALETVQALDPPGVGARDLTECLELQLRARPEADSLCTQIVHNSLEKAARNNLRAVAQEYGVPLTRVEACMEVIRGLNPSPVDLTQEDTRYIIPEFSVEVSPEGKIGILFHSDFFPTVRVDEGFAALSGRLTGEEKAFARKYLVSARQLIKAADLRQSTLEKLAAFIAGRHCDFFALNAALLPLSVTEAAESLGVHPTTIYRAIRGKYLRCDRGTFPLNAFFQREVSGFSVYDIRERIRLLCTAGPRLSDREIGERLEKEGIRIARRTVTKYRHELELSSSYFRAKR